MSTIIRATDQQRGVQQPQFNFEDMAAQASRYLDKIRGEAALIIAPAPPPAVTMPTPPGAHARAAAEKTIAQLVDRQLGQRLTTLWPSLQASVQQLRDAKQAWLVYWERNAVRLAAAIASRIIRRELTQQPEITLRLVQEALELAAGSAQVCVHLHPDDYRALGSQVQQFVAQTASLGECEIVADEAISAGGCRIETRFGAIDQQIESQLARIEEELT